MAASQDPFLSLPRLAGRLTADLISRAPQGLNACGEYELDVRGHKIGAVENLGATQNQFDAVDLSDNEIVRLEGFPALPRLHTLTLCNNRIARVAPGLEKALPALETLTLTNNRVTSFGDVDALAGLRRLRRLSLLGNPVAAREDYRLYVAHVLPSVAVLDFRKVKQAERDAARKKFGGREGEKARETARANLRAGRRRGGRRGDGDGRGRARRPHPRAAFGAQGGHRERGDAGGGDAARAGAHHRDRAERHAFVMC